MSDQEPLLDTPKNVLRLFTANQLGNIPLEGDRFDPNVVRTNKYSVLTFLPLNLMVQFSKMANVYFLFIVILEWIVIGTFDAMVSLAPLLFVVGVSMVKDIIEDHSRYKSDQEENDRPSHFNLTGSTRFVEDRARQIKVGCFVKVLNDENFPCDLVLVNSSLPKGICYVETKGLDGETNLKMKVARAELLDTTKTDQDLFQNLTGAEITCDLPNANLYRFQGKLKTPDNQVYPLSAD